MRKNSGQISYAEVDDLRKNPAEDDRGVLRAGDDVEIVGGTFLDRSTGAFVYNYGDWGLPSRLRAPASSRPLDNVRWINVRTAEDIARATSFDHLDEENKNRRIDARARAFVQAILGDQNFKQAFSVEFDRQAPEILNGRSGSGENPFWQYLMSFVMEFPLPDNFRWIAADETVNGCVLHDYDKRFYQQVGVLLMEGIFAHFKNGSLILPDFYADRPDCKGIINIEGCRFERKAGGRYVYNGFYPYITQTGGYLVGKNFGSEYRFVDSALFFEYDDSSGVLRMRAAISAMPVLEIVDGKPIDFQSNDVLVFPGPSCSINFLQRNLQLLFAQFLAANKD